MPEKETNKPVQVFRAGAVSASVWEYKNEKEGKTFTSHGITLQRGYKDKEGAWKNTESMKTADVPKAVYVFNKTYEYLITLKKEE